MAGRPIKEGLDYFELDCHMEEKVRLIQAEFGLKGFAIVVKLYQKIYGGHGYYCEWTQDSLLLFMLENGIQSDSKNLIQEIVSACIRGNIFSERLYKEYDILTSSGVQKRYLNATVKRETVILKKEYLLISVPENRINVVINSISDGRNSISVGKNAQRREKKSREEKRKVEESNTPHNPPTGKRETSAEITRRLYQTFMPEYGFSGALSDSIADWFEYRIERKEYFVSERGMKATLTRLKNLQSQHGDVELIEAIEYSMGNSYKGIFFEKKQSQGGGNSNYIDAIKNRVSEVDNW